MEDLERDGDSMSNRHLAGARHPERGSAIILIAFLWTSLFAMAALAIDMGHMYLAKRNLQEAADAAVMAGLPSLAASTTTATDKAKDMANKMGYTPKSPTPSVGTGAGGLKTLTVTLQTTEPFFFAKALGYSSKTFTATSVGQLGKAVPALYAGRNTCSGSPSPVVGIQFNGATTITGDIQSNGMANDYGDNTSVSGNITYGSGGGCTAAGFTKGGTKSATGGSLSDPYAFTAASFKCDYTQPSFSFGGLGFWWASGGPSGHGTLKSGTYCATSGDIDASGTDIDTSYVTLVSFTGHVRISANSADLHPYDTATNVVAYTPMAATDCGNPAINIGNNNVTLEGVFYAPNGCIQSSATTLNVTGALDGYQVQLSGGSNTVTSGSGSSGGYGL
jgi:Flp pilus assembly protein TadG